MGLAAPDAEDMVHDALLACLISIRSGAYSPRRGTVGCWFRSALRNRIIDHWRRLARGGAKVTSEDPLGLEARALDVGGFAEHGSLRESVMMALALDELDQRSHAAPRSAEVIRSAMAGVSVEQMARRLGTTPARLSLTKHRAVPRVVAIVRRLEHDSPARVDR
jgi:DNA-directed RNA polymerase specialized sigma24 family protein